jgi:hypothetical protein
MSNGSGGHLGKPPLLLMLVSAGAGFALGFLVCFWIHAKPKDEVELKKPVPTQPKPDESKKTTQ